MIVSRNGDEEVDFRSVRGCTSNRKDRGERRSGRGRGR